MLHYDATKRTFDCPPTLNDTQVLQFCRDGYLLLEGVVPDETNRRTCTWLAGEVEAKPSYIPAGLTATDLERIRRSH